MPFFSDRFEILYTEICQYSTEKSLFFVLIKIHDYYLLQNKKEKPNFGFPFFINQADIYNLPLLFDFYLSLAATTPGSAFPSKNSKEAPPPVEM